MQHPRTGYTHRGDGERRRERFRRVMLVTGFVVAVTLVARERDRDGTAVASSGTLTLSGFGQTRELRRQLDAARGELALVSAQLDRANAVITYSARYRIAADLASDIYEVALAEGIDPDLAFRLVRLESQFRERATSPVGAVGLTQLMLGTAKFFDKNVTREKLYDRRTNLRIGFRYLRTLIEEHDGDISMALTVYNRGPVAVTAARAVGSDPSNGYDRIVMKGYTGKGVVD